MNDVFIEQLIKRKISGLGILFRVLICAVVAFLALLMMFVFMVAGFYAMYVFFFVVLFCYLSYKVFQYTDIEYEYSYLNGEITVDKIKGQLRRKNVEVFDIKNAELCAPLGSDVEKNHHPSASNIPVKDLSSGFKNRAKYVVITNGKKGITKIIFEPNGEILTAMKNLRPRDVYLP